MLHQGASGAALEEALGAALGCIRAASGFGLLFVKRPIGFRMS